MHLTGTTKQHISLNKFSYITNYMKAEQIRGLSALGLLCLATVTTVNYSVEQYLV